MQRPNITKEPARDICPLAKVKVIHTNKTFISQQNDKTVGRHYSLQFPPTKHYSSTVSAATIHEQ